MEQARYPECGTSEVELEQSSLMVINVRRSQCNSRRKKRGRSLGTAHDRVRSGREVLLARLPRGRVVFGVRPLAVARIAWKGKEVKREQGQENFVLELLIHLNSENSWNDISDVFHESLMNL